MKSERTIFVLILVVAALLGVLTSLWLNTERVVDARIGGVEATATVKE